MRSTSLRPARPHPRRRLRARLGTTLAATAVLAASGLHAGLTRPADHSGSATSVRSADLRTTAATANPVTPGGFTGYAFDQCQAPTQASMNRWLSTSPFLAAGIYISGDSRACRNQTNLDATWVRRQLAAGWRLLPLTMGPQASCNPRFPRYSDDFRISPRPGNGSYPKARREGVASATSTVQDAQALGITAGSTLWYDLEGFDSSDTACRQSALAFVSAWVARAHALGYRAGVYSSASSGIRVLDQAKTASPKAYTYPDAVWIADWNGRADVYSSYLGNQNWMPHARVHQYQGGHDETWGGVRINIDRSYLDIGGGSQGNSETHCGGVTVSFPAYDLLPLQHDGTAAPADQIAALQCLLQEKAGYTGKIDGLYTRPVKRATRAWQQAHGFPVDTQGRWFRRDWISLLAAGDKPVLKFGSSGLYVRRVQRALVAAQDGHTPLHYSGVFDAATAAAVRSYQKALKLPVTGIVEARTWDDLVHGLR